MKIGFPCGSSVPCFTGWRCAECSLRDRRPIQFIWNSLIALVLPLHGNAGAGDSNKRPVLTLGEMCKVQTSQRDTIHSLSAKSPTFSTKLQHGWREREYVHLMVTEFLAQSRSRYIAAKYYIRSKELQQLIIWRNLESKLI